MLRATVCRCVCRLVNIIKTAFVWTKTSPRFGVVDRSTVCIALELGVDLLVSERWPGMDYANDGVRHNVRLALPRKIVLSNAREPRTGGRGAPNKRKQYNPID